MAQLPAGYVPLIQRWLGWLRRPTPSIDTTVWQQALARSELLRALDAERNARLAQLSAQFLREKTITPAAGLVLDDVQRTLLAALCCLPLLEFGARGMQGWSQLIVYPEAFVVPRSEMDEHGVLHEWDDALIGEAWDSGPMILSWADVQADIDDARSGCCVAVHEMAHKIDTLDGVLDGTPPLPATWRQQWAVDFQRSYQALRDQLDKGQQTDLDPYAAEAPEEFFAVVSEYHYSAPEVLAEAMPDVAAHLSRFYGPPPFANATTAPRAP